MFRLIIAGSRTFTDYPLMKKKMDFLLSKTEDEVVILCGKARGADALGERYARERGYEIEYYPADWDRYGKAAGAIRNEEMCKSADAITVFWDGSSPGTRNVLKLAEKYNLDIKICRF